ncbi:hypothetical protein [Rhodococcus jostii]|uniref:hypothetical protein n=1 Tax=Rhodococcus jostii TaxID=132919 RepID=UPI0036452BD2
MTNPNASTTASSPRKKLLRAILVAPVAVGVLAGAVVAGTGISAAATGPAGAAESAAMHRWSVTNDTGDSVWGKISKRVGNDSSALSWTEGAPLLPNGSEEAFQVHDPIKAEFTDVGICYRGSLWVTPSVGSENVGEIIRLSPGATDPNVLTVSSSRNGKEWTPVWLNQRPGGC